MNQVLQSEPSQGRPKYFDEIATAIANRSGLSFVYERADGTIVTHNAVYPREQFQAGGQFYFRGYCYFSCDTRVFRFDRIKSLQVQPRAEARADRRQVLDIIIGILLLALVFLLLLLFGKKYSWRRARERLGLE